MRTERKWILGLGLVAVAYGAVLFFQTPPEGTLDARVGYDLEGIRLLLASQGELGRAQYATHAFVDLGYPLFYGAVLFVWLRALRRRGAAFCFPALAIVAGVVDLVETSSIVVILGAYPDLPSPYAQVAMIATPLKWLSFCSALLMIAAGEIASHVRKARS